MCLVFENLKVLLRRGLGTQSLAAYQRCLLSTATEPNVKPGNETTKTEGDTNSGKEEKSGDSHQSSNTGKSVRGGVMFTLFVVEYNVVWRPSDFH